MTDPKPLVAEHLTSIRQNTNWRQLFKVLKLTKDEQKSRDHDWWGKSPFRPTEKTASFHMNARGWYCHSTGRGGGPIELVQQLYLGMHCFDAGRWLLEHGVSRIVNGVREDVGDVEDNRSDEEGRVDDNPAIRQDLRKLLDPRHPTCADRGIPSEVLYELGAGYLDRPARKGSTRDPLNHRLVFQIRTVRQDLEGTIQPVIVGHIGRATTPIQEEREGKWWTYARFRKSLELYNLDLALLDEVALVHALDSGHYLVVEGPFDVARLYAAGIRNVVATLGSSLSEPQLRRLKLLAETSGVKKFLFFFDRDRAGIDGAGKAVEVVASSAPGLEAEMFDWTRTWSSAERKNVSIPATITDPAEFSLGQLQWLRSEGIL